MENYTKAQTGRTLVHPALPQPNSEHEDYGGKIANMTDSTDESPPFSFVICADTQFGMRSENIEWEIEKNYSYKAIKYINEMNPRPLFCCVCGDLVHMEYTFFSGKEDIFSKNECDEIQKKQREDYQKVWSELHEDIALVCVCGNHDIGNRPSRASIESFKSYFGDDYLAFWSPHRCYNIVLNTTLFSDPTNAQDLYQKQLDWLKDRLEYAKSNDCKSIFLFGHHPWFLYDENEKAKDMNGYSPFHGQLVQDSYFHIPMERRMVALELFRKYQVKAAFAGHFHQNLVTHASFGMKMIVTSSLSEVLESTGKPMDLAEPSTRGMRIVQVSSDGSFQHEFMSLPE